VDDNDHFAKLWKCIALQSAQHFAWRVFVNRIATKDNLSKRGMTLGNRMCEKLKKN